MTSYTCTLCVNITCNTDKHILTHIEQERMQDHMDNHSDDLSYTSIDKKTTTTPSTTATVSCPNSEDCNFKGKNEIDMLMHYSDNHPLKVNYAF